MRCNKVSSTIGQETCQFLRFFVQPVLRLPTRKPIFNQPNTFSKTTEVLGSTPYGWSGCSELRLIELTTFRKTQYHYVWRSKGSIRKSALGNLQFVERENLSGRLPGLHPGIHFLQIPVRASDHLPKPLLEAEAVEDYKNLEDPALLEAISVESLQTLGFASFLTSVDRRTKLLKQKKENLDATKRCDAAALHPKNPVQGRRRVGGSGMGGKEVGGGLRISNHKLFLMGQTEFRIWRVPKYPLWRHSHQVSRNCRLGGNQSPLHQWRYWNPKNFFRQ